MTNETTLNAEFANPAFPTEQRTSQSCSIETPPANRQIRSGLCEEIFHLTPDEEPKEYRQFAEGLLNCLQPADELEEYFAEKLIQGAWRLRRARKIEANFFIERMTSAKTDDPHMAVKYDFDNVFDRVSRYEARLSASFHRAFYDLMFLRGQREQKTPEKTV